MLYEHTHRACDPHPQLGGKRYREDQRPVFAQVDSLAQAVREVNAVWKLLSPMTTFPACSGLRSRLARRWASSANGRGTIRWISRAPATAKANAWRNGWPTRGCRCRMGISGDNYNDLGMLEAAGTGVAMGNAVDEVKARANIVIGDNAVHQHRRSLSTASCCNQAANRHALIWATPADLALSPGRPAPMG